MSENLKFNTEELNLNSTLLLEIFTHYCLEDLNLKNVNIELNICDLDNTLRGYVLDEENSYKVFVKNSMDIDTTCKTIAHELIHVKQFVYDDLDKYIKNNKIDYIDTWWEEQAFKGSFKIYKKFVDTKAMEILATGIEIYHEKILKRK